MESEKESTPSLSQNYVNRPGAHVLETPLGLEKIAGPNVTGDFSGFENGTRGTMRRLVNMEREMRCMKEVLEGIMGKCDVRER